MTLGAQSEECHASVTYQFRDPAPSGLFRAYWPRIRHTPDMKNCLQHISRMSGCEGKKGDAKTIAERLDKVRSLSFGPR